MFQGLMGWLNVVLNITVIPIYIQIDSIYERGVALFYVYE